MTRRIYLLTFNADFSHKPPSSTPFRVATTDSVETTEEPGDVEDKMTKIANFANIDNIDDVDNVERDLEMVEGPLDVCEEYSACVVYLVSVSLR